MQSMEVGIGAKGEVMKISSPNCERRLLGHENPLRHKNFNPMYLERTESCQRIRRVASRPILRPMNDNVNKPQMLSLAPTQLASPPFLTEFLT